jgi:hypothetical protein
LSLGRPQERPAPAGTRVPPVRQRLRRCGDLRLPSPVQDQSQEPKRTPRRVPSPPGSYRPHLQGLRRAAGFQQGEGPRRFRRGGLRRRAPRNGGSGLPQAHSGALGAQASQASRRRPVIPPICLHLIRSPRSRCRAPVPWRVTTDRCGYRQPRWKRIRRRTALRPEGREHAQAQNWPGQNPCVQGRAGLCRAGLPWSRLRWPGRAGTARVRKASSPWAVLRPAAAHLRPGADPSRRPGSCTIRSCPPEAAAQPPAQ